MKNLIIILIILGAAAGIWWLVAAPEPLPTDDSAMMGTQLADDMVGANSVIYENEATSISVTYTSEQAILTGLGYADVRLTAVPSATDIRYEAAESGLILWDQGEEVTVYLNDEVVFEGTATSDSASVSGDGLLDLDSVTENSAPETATLTAQTWVWQETVMNNGDTITPDQPGAFTLTFTAEGSVNGTTDCNNFAGSYEVTDGTATFGPLGMTKMYCEGSQEQVFVDIFDEPLIVFFDQNDNLVLLLPYDSGSVIFAPQV